MWENLKAIFFFGWLFLAIIGISFNIAHLTKGRNIDKILQDEICLLREENSRLLTLLEKKEEKKLYLLKVSAYTPRKKETDSTPHLTALNKKSRPGKTAAVGSDCLELLGTEIYVKGLGVFHCTDRKPSKGIDLMVGNVKEAKKIGNTTRQVVKIKD